MMTGARSYDGRRIEVTGAGSYDDKTIMMTADEASLRGELQ